MLSVSRFLLSFVVLLFSSCLWAGEVILNITNTSSDDGYLLAALHDQAVSFPNDGVALMYLKVKAAAGQTTMRFSVDTPADYAVSLFHNENDNGVLDTNYFGLPTNGIGFSNNAKGDFFCIPSFLDASFHVEKDAIVTQSIVLHY